MDMGLRPHESSNTVTSLPCGPMRGDCAGARKNEMRTLYVHGFGSRFDPDNIKVKALRRLGEVVGVDVDYCAGFETAVSKVSAAASHCDLIVGTSMGGYLASHVGAAIGIPFVALNPAVKPSETLCRHIGTFVDYVGRHSTLREETVAGYPDIQMVGGCGLILLEAGDDVIDPEVTLNMLRGIYTVKMYEGGSHRFEGLPGLLGEIEEFMNMAEAVYGF
jgi:uncharacterized protein